MPTRAMPHSGLLGSRIPQTNWTQCTAHPVPYVHAIYTSAFGPLLALRSLQPQYRKYPA